MLLLYYKDGLCDALFVIVKIGRKVPNRSIANYLVFLAVRVSDVDVLKIIMVVAADIGRIIFCRANGQIDFGPKQFGHRFYHSLMLPA